MAIRMYGGSAAAVFTPLDPLTRPEQVERRLVDGIVLGLLPPGHQLPGELELGTLFGVSTVTVREALRSLRQLGLVRTTRGRGGGSFVCTPPESLDVLMRERLLRLSTAQIRDIGDLYAALSGTAARLAARRSGADDLRRLRRAERMVADATTEGARARAESHLYIDVAAAAQSPLLFRREIDLQAEIAPLLRLGPPDATYRPRLNDLAARLVEAVAAGDGAAARVVAEERAMLLTARLVAVRLDVVEEAS